MSYNQLYKQAFEPSIGSSDNDHVAMITSEVATKVEPINFLLTYGNVKSANKIDCGTVCSIIKKPSFAHAVGDPELVFNQRTG